MPVVRRLLATVVLASLAACGEVATQQPDAAIDAPLVDTPTVDTPSDVTLTVVPAGTASGRVVSAPIGIDCGATCTMTATAGTVITLTATADPGATFAGWSGGSCTGTATCTVTLAAATTVTATFDRARYTVTVNLMGNGTGAVTSTPAGIACPGTCTLTVDHGATIDLAAGADAASTFVGWGGSCVGTGGCTLTVTSNTTVNAGFALNSSLLVQKTGNGAGTVTSAPTGINCGADCTEAYTPGTVVTLTAAASTGSTFTGWSGAGCTGTGVCTITLNAAQMVTATFTLNQYTLTVARAGAGTGTVTSNPAGINCGADCSEQVNHGQAVVLMAAPAANSTFTGWSGAGCSGTGNCTVTVTAAATVTATFAVIQHTLTVTRTGAGTGTISSNPAGINCGATCAAPFNQGTSVTLTVTAAFGSTFSGWSGGGCTGTATTCTVTINAATTVTAAFTATSTTVSGTWACLGSDSCTDLYDFSFPADTNVTIAVSAVAGGSVLRLGAFAPGVPYSGVNLLTGIAADRECTTAQNVGDTITFKAVAAGTYRLSIGRDWGPSSGNNGSYTLNVSATAPLTSLGLQADDRVEGTTMVRCGYIATFSSNWACAAGVSCQDTWRFDSLAATTATVAVTSVTGNSRPRLAVFNGTTVTTTNQINNLLSDRMCVATNTNDTATTASLPAGQHLFAIGRDWGSSAGSSGTYIYTITTPNLPLIPGGQITNDTGSAFNGTCP